MRLGDFLTGLNRPVAYFAPLAPVVGGVNAAIFLCQLAYWCDRGADPDGWIYKTQTDWAAETGLSRREQETARRELRDRGILHEDKRGVPALLYYRLDMDALEAVWQAAGYGLQDGGNRQTRMAVSAILERTKAPSLRGGNRHPFIQENTTESTTESGPGCAGTRAPTSSEGNEGLRLVRSLGARRITAGMVREAGHLLALYATAGRSADLAAQVEEWAAHGWQWSSFVTVARERLSGTASSRPIPFPNRPGQSQRAVPDTTYTDEWAREQNRIQMERLNAAMAARAAGG